MYSLNSNPCSSTAKKNILVPSEPNTSSASSAEVGTQTVKWILLIIYKFLC